ncbi:hypothetical protein [Morganella morganii]|uniref:hypothetical protein n=1 Tax=Morganella morganii TaxID=582 RepID=UPI003139185F
MARVRIFNIFLRGSTLLCRFLFIFFLAKYVEPSVVGIYGLFTAAIGYSLYLVGLDFYTYTTREILKSKSDIWGRYLKSQFYLSSILYVLLFIVSLPFILNGVVEFSILYWFVPILFLEHVNQELFRLLIALSKQTVASICLFIRQGTWALAAVGIMVLNESARYIELVFSLWLIAGVIAAIFGAYVIYSLQFGGWVDRVDIGWIKTGIKTSTFFLVATLAVRGVQTFDRYWLEALADLDVVGAYILFVGVAGTAMTFLDAGVFSFAYPKLINTNNQSNKIEFDRIIKKMSLLTVGFIAIFIGVSLVLLPYLLDWIGRDVYLKYTNLYIWVLLATIFNALSMIPHYALYAHCKDKAIVLSHCSSAFVFFASTTIFIYWDKELAVPLGVVVAFAFIFLFKTWFYIKQVKNS